MNYGGQAERSCYSLEGAQTVRTQGLTDSRCEAGGDSFVVEVTFHLHLEGLDPVCEVEMKKNDSLWGGQCETGGRGEALW